MFVHRLKLSPPRLPVTWFVRPDLELRLGEGVRVFAVVAAAGYGKSLLAARVFERWQGPRFWYGLDPSDADLAVFATHLDAITSADRAFRRLGADASRLETPRDVGSLFVESIAGSPEPVLAVFDDVHALRESRALVAFRELVERGVRAGVTFVLTGRSMPLPLHGFAAAGQLASIGAADLAFNPDEVDAYLARVARRHPGDSSVSELLALAAGWPAGVALVASSVAPLDPRGALRPAVSADEARRLLFDYLASEALAELSNDERDVLLRASILDRLDSDLCDAVLERSGSRDVLAGLARRGSFVSQERDDAFRIHQLFHAFLSAELERTMPHEEVVALRRRAAVALDERDDGAGAIAQLLDAGDLDEAADALDSSAVGMLRLGLPSAVGRLLQRIDDARIEARAALLLAKGRDLRERGDWDAALAYLERATASALATERYEVLSESVRIAATILASRGEFDRLRKMLDRALALGERLPVESATTLRMTLAAVDIETERFDEALRIFREITPEVIARGDQAAQGSVLHNTAVAHLRRGDLYAGLALYERAYKLKERSGQRVSSLLTLGDLVYTRMLLGDLDDAQRLCNSLLSAARDFGGNAAVAHALENQGTLHLLQGDFTGADTIFREAQASCDPGDVLVMPDILHGLAQCALARGALFEADEWSATSASLFRGAGRFQQMAPILVTRAKIFAARGDTAGAYDAATEAAAAASRGADAVLEAMTQLDAAALLVQLASALPAPLGPQADAKAAGAAAAAVATIHQRDYRFLLRTREAAFGVLSEHLRRWQIGELLRHDGSAEAPRRVLRIETLGGFDVYVDGRPVRGTAWKRRKAREIFALLVNARGRPVPRSRLTDLYWPELDADAANDSLRVTISAIRKAVGNVVVYGDDGYRFAPPGEGIVDRDLFDERIERAREALARGDDAESRRLYETAARMYHGEFLEGMDEGGWQWHDRERLRAACLEALRAVSADPDPAIARLALERLLEVAPFDLDAVRLRLQRLVDEQRIAEARRDYADWCNRYRSAIGADPPNVWDSLPAAV